MNEKTILIADDDNELCQAIALRCRRLGLNTVVANNGIQAMHLAETLGPDLICLDVEMPGGNGLAVCEMLRGIESIASAPVAILTGRSDSETIDRCKQLGANYIRKSSNAWNELETLISDTLLPNSEDNWVRLEPASCETNSERGASQPVNPGSRPLNETDDPILCAIYTALGIDQDNLDLASILTNGVSKQAEPESDEPKPSSSEKTVSDQPWILHVDDDVDLSNALKLRLEVHGVSVAQAFNGRNGVKQAFAKPVSAIILDFEMPNVDGRCVLQTLKICEATKHIPVIILTGHRSDTLKQELLAIGAASFLEKPIRFETMFSTLSEYIDFPKPRGAACLLS